MPKTNYPVCNKLLRLIPPVGIVLILGSEGSGKSNLGYGILESLKDSGRQLLVYGLPLEKSIYLPDWIKIGTSLDFPEGSVVLADEAYISWHSRESMRAANKFMDLFSGLVRQKDILAVYITQFSRKLDIGLVSAPRVLLIKQPSLLQLRLDRSELRAIIASAASAFKAIEQSSPKAIVQSNQLGADAEFDPRCLAATYVVSTRFEGMLLNSNRSPSFWSEELSKAWKGVSLVDGLGLSSDVMDTDIVKSLCVVWDDCRKEDPELAKALDPYIDILWEHRGNGTLPSQSEIAEVNDVLTTYASRSTRWSSQLNSIKKRLEGLTT